MKFASASPKATRRIGPGIPPSTDPAEGRDAGIDYRGDIAGTRHVSRDCLTETALRLDDPVGLEGRVEILMSAAKIFAPSRAKSTAVALPLSQPGPLEPAPETSATFSLSRSPMASSL
jgi:hypothetical protein